MNEEILTIAESVSNEKDLPKETIFALSAPLALMFPLAVILVVTFNPFLTLKSFDIASLSTIDYIL